MIDDANQPTYKRIRKAILFTDIEGSTHWLNEKGPSVVFRALEEHFILLESSFAQHKGEIVNRMGDGVMAVFPSIEKAIRGAVEAQQRINVSRADGANPLLLPAIRMSISAGETFLVTTLDSIQNYFGRVCTEARKVLDLAHGHHIIVAAEALTREEFKKDALITDGVRFSKIRHVVHKGLGAILVLEVLYRPHGRSVSNVVLGPEISKDGFIKPQRIFKNRFSMAPLWCFNQLIGGNRQS